MRWLDGSIEVVSKKRGPVALDPVWEALGVPLRSVRSALLKVHGARFRVTGVFRAKTRVEDDGVSLARSGEELTAVEVRVLFDDAEGQPRDPHEPVITLRQETEGDRRDKRTGLVKEVQTGDADFDREVFIDHESSDADVHRVLGQLETRDAVLRLMEHRLGPVRITRRGLRLQVEMSRRAMRVDVLREVIEDALTVAQAGGPEEPGVARAGESLLAVAVALAVLSALAAVYFVPRVPAAMLVLFVGLVAGGAAATALRAPVERLVGGDAGSGRRTDALLLSLVVFIATFSSAVFFKFNEALAGPPVVVRRGVVIEEWSERSALRRSTRRGVVVRWSDGEEERRGVGFQRGERLVELEVPGGLGVRWTEVTRAPSR